MSFASLESALFSRVVGRFDSTGSGVSSVRDCLFHTEPREKVRKVIVEEYDETNQIFGRKTICLI
jgi:hypothetical protein